MDKIRILSVGECSYLHSGYARYNHGLLTELHKNPRFQIMEYGLFYNPMINDAKSVAWDFFPNCPPEFAVLDTAEKLEGWKNWAANTHNHMGAPLFEAVLLDAKPDIVIANNDAWQLKYLIDSPYRRFYKLACLFACDSIPQNWSWIEDMALCDAVLTYSDWAKEEIEKQTPAVKIAGVASPSCQPSFQPLNKKMIREEWGIPATAKVIGTVMRNQIRKLFPSLFSTFKKYLETTGDTSTYLYVHSKYPDGSWCFPQLIQESGIAHRVLFTYKCQDKRCGYVFPSHYQDIAQCPKCNQYSGTMPGTMDGVTADDLCKIYNCMDLFVLHSSSEGWGIPGTEAASCGIPLAMTDYASMRDMIKKLGAEPIKVGEYYKELNTGQDRAVPDEDSLLSILVNFFSKPSSVRGILGMRAKSSFDKYYGYDKTAKVWERVIEAVYSGPSNWSGNPQIHTPAAKPESHMSNVDFARFLIASVGGQSYRLNSFFENEIVRNLNFGVRANTVTNGGAGEYNKSIAYDEFKQIGEARRVKEEYRIRKLGLNNG